MYEIPEYTENATRRSSVAKEQISLKTPNPKCRLFLKIDQQRYLAAGVYLSEAPDPLPPPRYTLYFFTQGRGTGEVDTSVRRLEGRIVQKRGENANMTDCISSL